MKSTIIKNLIATTLLTGVVVTAATFNGGATLDLAKTKINELTQTITTFGTNETTLKNKIVSLKSELETLQTQITKGEGDKDLLNTKVKELEAQIISLEEQLDKANSETVKANGEVKKANDLAAELQAIIDTNKETIETTKPMTQEEINALVGEVVTPTTPEVIPPIQDPAPTKETLSFSNVGSKYQDKNVMVEVKEGNNLLITNTDPSGLNSPYWYETNGEFTNNLDFGANREETFKVGDVVKVFGKDGVLIVQITLAE